MHLMLRLPSIATTVMMMTMCVVSGFKEFDHLSNNSGHYDGNNSTNTTIHYEWTVLRQLGNVVSVSAAFNPLTNSTELFAMVQNNQQARAQRYFMDDYYGSQQQQQQQRHPSVTIYKATQKGQQQSWPETSKFVKVVAKRSMHPASSFEPPQSPTSDLSVGPFESWGVMNGKLLRCINPCNGEWHPQPFHPNQQDNTEQSSFHEQRFRSEYYHPQQQQQQQQYIGQNHHQINQLSLSSKYALVLVNRQQIYKMSLSSLDQTQTGRNWELIESDGKDLSSISIAPNGDIFAVDTQNGLLRRFNSTGWASVPIKEDSMVLEKVSVGRQRLFVADRSGLIYTAPVNATKSEEWIKIDGIRGVKSLSSMQLEGQKDDVVVAVNSKGRICVGRIKK